MPRISIDISEEALGKLEKRAKKNFLSVRELIEDIVRRSAVNYKSGPKAFKVDDRLVGIFSRENKGPKKGAKKAKEKVKKK